MTQKNDTISAQDLARERTDWAYERTQMASTRTFFALLRTGLAIAGGGSAITAVLAEGWPDWVVGLLAGVFIVIGFSIMLGGLQRYRQLAERLRVENDFAAIPVRLVVVMTVALQVATVIVLVLFLLR